MTQDRAKSDAEDLRANWERCIYIDAVFDDNLVSRLTPKILALRQKSSAPITVAIDSVGGSLDAMSTILSLLTGPDQDGQTCLVVTVVTHRAYSAAATFLALSDYAVALPHSDLLFHDVRYGGMDDVTPDRALVAAKQLNATNENASLRLATRMFGRWMWNYLDTNTSFEADRKQFPTAAERYSKALRTFSPTPNSSVRFDIAGFATSMFARLSRENETLIDRAMDHLKRWGTVLTHSEKVQRFSGENESVGLLDGILHLYNSICSEASTTPFGDSNSEEDISLLITLILNRLAAPRRPSSITSFERALSDFQLIKSIEDPKHVDTATLMMARHRFVFLELETAAQWETMSQDERDIVMTEATPIVKLAWLFCVLVARELFHGDHKLSAKEAMYLGLVDEAPGLSEIRSRREYLQTRAQEDATPQERIPYRLIKRRIRLR
jgi:ATP-dependent protease ClpP protease subunit